MITNFGANLRFTPRHRYQPATEAEVLAILDRHARGKIRVVGALHSWSPAVVSEDVLIDLAPLDHVEIQRDADGTVWAVAGGGCRIKHLLRKLHALAEVTMPTLGLITEQTIAGAISTATHGSGRNSLSHYIDEMRVAAYDSATGRACIHTWRDGVHLRAARCALGCMGVILTVKFRCVPLHDIAETIVPLATLDEVLAGEDAYPLQQFYLAPYLWSYFVQRRAVTPVCRPRRSLAAKLYRVWWFGFIDVGLHVVIKMLVYGLKSPGLTRFFYRHILARTILKNRTVIDRSERMLVMEHELFKHLEIEIFVPASRLQSATALVRTVIEMFAGTIVEPDAASAAPLSSIGMLDELRQRRGSFTHHYPITFRRVLPDDTLISMTAGAAEPWYAISMITYVEPREPFYALASYLARALAQLHGARLHWGKYFPLDGATVERSYPQLPEFRALCRQVDPHGVFRNDFVERVLFGAISDSESSGRANASSPSE